MKKLKRISTLMIALTMLASLATGCANSEENSSSKENSSEVSSSNTENSKEDSSTEEGMVGNIYVSGLPIAKEPVTYKLLNTKNTWDKSASQNEKAIMQIAADGTNVTIEWSEASDAGIAEQLGLLLTAGEALPDGFHNTWVSDDQIAMNTSRFYEMTPENLETFCPNIFKGVSETIPGGLDALKKADGKIYSLPGNSWTNQVAESRGVMQINQAWVENVGKEMPATVNDLYEILVAFKNDDPNQNGENDEIPYILAASDISSSVQVMANAWGIGGRDYHYQDFAGKVIDGKYEFMLNTQAARDWLTEMNKWYNEGLMNQDVFSITNSEYSSLKNQNVQGMFAAWAPVDKENRQNWTHMPVIAADGYEDVAMKTGQEGYRVANMNTFSITSACKEPEGLLRWWDNLHRDIKTKQTGSSAEGILWEYNEAGDLVEITDVEIPVEFANMSEYKMTIGWPNFMPIMFAGEGTVLDMSVDTDTVRRVRYSNYYRDYFLDEFIPITPIPAEASEDFALVKNEMETYFASFIANAVTKGITDESWNKHLSDLEGYGLQEYIEFYQNYIDGTF